VDVLSICVYDVDSSNAGIGLRFTSFGWNNWWWLGIGCLVIPNILIGLRLQVFGHSFS
jgi:hypothetical protein